jgi:hypothetical protein
MESAFRREIASDLIFSLCKSPQILTIAAPARKTAFAWL